MNNLTITSDLVDTMLTGFGAGARIKLEFSATETGSYSHVDYIDLQPGIRSYDYDHVPGVDGDWYRFRFEDITGANANSWSDPFQSGDETGGYLCSLEDVLEELKLDDSDANRNERILEKIRQVSAEIERYTGRWLAPRPTNPASTTTLLFDVEADYWTRGLLLSSEFRVCGIRTLTALSIASTSQPETGGAYTSVPLANVFLRPRPTADGPATRLELSNLGGTYFYRGYATVQVTGSFGYAQVPADIQAAAVAAVVRRYGSGMAAPTISLGEQGLVLLPNFSKDMMETIGAYRVPNVA